MLHLYNESPVTISIGNNQKLVNVNFCNIKMKLRFCQFKLFHNYLMGKSEKICPETTHVDLLLVKDNLNVTIELSHFLQLCHGVQSVIAERFGFNIYSH